MLVDLFQRTGPGGKKEKAHRASVRGGLTKNRSIELLQNISTAPDYCPVDNLKLHRANAPKLEFDNN